MKQGILCKTEKTNDDNKDLLVLPKSLLQILRNSMHYGILSNHASTRIMYEKIKEQYYYPDLKKTLEKIGKSCILCAINKPTYGKQLDFGKKVYPNAPRLGWSFDIACGYPSIKGYQYIYLYVDDFSGYSICIPAKTRSSEEILRSLRDNLVKYFGYPNYIYCDKEKGCHSSLMEQYCQAHGIDLRSTAGNSPYSNGFCEKTIGILKIAINLLIRSQGKSWLEVLGHANLALNQQKLSSGFSPEMLALGQNSQTTALLQEEESFKNHKDFSKFMTSKLDKMYEQHALERERRTNKNREYMNKFRKEKQFQQGEYVTLKNNEVGQGEGGSIKNKNFGVYEITSINERERCCILKQLGNGKERGAHLMHLRPLDTEDNMEPVPIRNEASRLITANTPQIKDNTIASRSDYNLRSKNHNLKCIDKKN